MIARTMCRTDKHASELALDSQTVFKQEQGIHDCMYCVTVQVASSFSAFAGGVVTFCMLCHSTVAEVGPSGQRMRNEDRCEQPAHTHLHIPTIHYCLTMLQ